MYESVTYSINGALFKVFNSLGNMWGEEIYEKALEWELKTQGLKAERQKKYEVYYFDRNVGNFRVDLLVEDVVIVELKVVPRILPLHRAQVISYLKGFGKPLAILANFGGMSMEHQTFPRFKGKTPLRNDFDIDKAINGDKEEIKDLLIMANRILTTLGAGYFHHIYRRAFHWELKVSGIQFDTIKEVVAKYGNQSIGTREVNFLS